jgi:hypothetical protein
MAKKKKIYQSPLLYIAQPTQYEVEAFMQSYASSLENEEKEKKIQKNPMEEGKVQSSEGSSRKAFKDMTIPEKIDYLLSLPDQMPRMKCEVYTNHGRYRGIILALENNMIKMKTFQTPSRVEILVDDIEDIRLKGF